MSELPFSLQAQQLVELLELMSTFADEPAATRGAVERAAEVLEAEVAALVVGGRAVESVGFPAGATPHDALADVAAGRREELDVPGVGPCHCATVALGTSAHGHLVLARSGPDGFTVDECNLLRGMGRMLDLSLEMIRTVDTLRRRQRLMDHLYAIQRAISRRTPLHEVLETIVGGVAELFGDVVVGLWLLDSHDRETALLVSSTGLAPELTKRLWRLPLAESGAVGAAIATDALTESDTASCPAGVLRRLMGGTAGPIIAAPVHESGAVAGSLVVMGAPDVPTYGTPHGEVLLAFAEHVTLALTDAKTLNDMHMAFHDSLTGLASRALFLDRVQDGVRCAERDGSRVALLFVDLDRFKSVNDSFGHGVGDLLLMGVAQRLQSTLRGGDVAARLGGDEFAVMLQSTTETQATAVADRIIAALSEPFVIGGHEMRVGASVGISMSTGVAEDTSELLRRADLAMYEAKRAGRGRREVFSPDLELEFSERQANDDLRWTLDEVVYGGASAPRKA